MNDMRREAYVIDGIRTPFGKYKGALASLSTIDLGQRALAELLRRQPWATRPDAALLGVVVQAGLGQNPARIASVRGGVDPTTPALTLNNVCLAGLEAVCDATRRIRLAEGSTYLVGGFDSMTRAARVLPSANCDDAEGAAPRSALMSDGLGCLLAGVSMGELSDRCNREMGISRSAQDEYAFMSQQRAAAAAVVMQSEEIFALDIDGQRIAFDQCIRAQTQIASLSALAPAFEAEGTITAGNASQMADGASVGLVVDAGTMERMGVTPLARVVDWAWVAGPDFSLHLKPADAISKLLSQQRLKASDIDLYEINEAFAGVVLASCRALGLGVDVVNVNGGAIALGHPLGATGFRLLLTLALELRRRGVRRGVASLCGGGGQGLAVLIENPAFN